jgi:23S rRNA pseudouridine1911/1915/1917 synthase
MSVTYTAGNKDVGRELKQLLRHELKFSAALIRKLKNTGGIFVNSRPVFTNYRLSEGDIVCCAIELTEGESGVLPEQGEIEIVFEDEWLIAVNKPSGLLSHPSRAKYTGTLANYVSFYLNGVCHAVNRLDRDTSGIVLFAKSAHAKARASAALSSEDASKKYLALVYGGLDESCGVIDAPIKRLQERDMRRGVREDGERAITHYSVLKTFEFSGEKASLVDIRLETGRTHQIRVHFEHIGHPLIGDILYYTPKSRELSQSLGINAHGLHAYELKFTHPFTNEQMYLSCCCRRPDLEGFLDEYSPIL